jgi:heterodisulfide reductase subunit A
MAEKKPTGTVLVAGAGISGIKAAIELAESGYKVILSDDSPQMGGILAKLDYHSRRIIAACAECCPGGPEYALQYCMRKACFMKI